MNDDLQKEIKLAAKVLILANVSGLYVYVTITKKAAEEFLDDWKTRYDRLIPYEVREIECQDGRTRPWLYIG